MVQFHIFLKQEILGVTVISTGCFNNCMQSLSCYLTSCFGGFGGFWGEVYQSYM